jgi:hypothetical protein
VSLLVRLVPELVLVLAVVQLLLVVVPVLEPVAST